MTDAPTSSAGDGAEAPDGAAPRRAVGIPLRAIVLLATCLPALLVAGVLFVIADGAAQRVTDAFATEVVDATEHEVRVELDRFLDTAARTSDLVARRIASGTWAPRSYRDWTEPSSSIVRTFPEVASVGWGDERGATFWTARDGAGGIVLALAEPGTATIREFAIDEAGVPAATPVRSYPFDLFARPWYETGVEAAEPTWTEVYVWAATEGADDQIGLAIVRPAISGTDRGVVGVDVTLGALATHLRRLDAASIGLVMVVDGAGKLVATSRGTTVGEDGERRRAEDAARAAGSGLRFEFDDSARRGSRDTVDGEPARVRIASYERPGIDWRIVVAVRDSAFLGEVRATRRRALVVAAIAALVVLGLGGVAATAIGRRVDDVRGFLRTMAAGDFEERLDARGPREWRELVEALNRTAEDLGAFMETRQALEVARQVQRSLLPERVPEIDGIDVFGRSRYCDQTGGDYYDFVAGEPDPEDRTLTLALGDVMGHGVAAALLMATARAALRATTLGDVPLGEVLARVNRVLAQDARHNRFMTMVLMTVDPQRRTLRWASAGHDPVLILDPATGDFIEPAGGGLPLGIVAEETYETHLVEELPASAVLFIGTDGMWETRGPDGDQFGKDRLRAVLREHAGEPADRIGAAVEAALAAHRAGLERDDDETYVVLRLD